MVLIYAYIQQYKNFSHQEFNFHREYHVHFSEPEGTIAVSYRGADPIQRAFFRVQRGWTPAPGGQDRVRKNKLVLAAGRAGGVPPGRTNRDILCFV